jgi:hypothetical protein
MSSSRGPRGRTRMPIPQDGRRSTARARFTRAQIEEIKTTGKLVVCIAGAALLAMGLYIWLAGAPTESAEKPAPIAPDTVPEVIVPGQADGDAALRARAQRSCDEGNQDACTLLQAPDPSNVVNDSPEATRKQP